MPELCVEAAGEAELAWVRVPVVVKAPAEFVVEEVLLLLLVDEVEGRLVVADAFTVKGMLEPATALEIPVGNFQGGLLGLWNVGRVRDGECKGVECLPWTMPGRQSEQQTK